MTENSSPKSKLANFSPVPRRAFADRRMKARHLKVLGAICVAVDSPTGAALISQKRVAHHAGIARQKVGDVIADLKEFGYIAPIPRGRTQRGRFKTIVYRVLYEQAGASCSEPDDHHVTPVGDMDRVTPGGDRTVSPPGVTETFKDQTFLPLPDLQRRATALTRQLLAGWLTLQTTGQSN